MNARSIRNKPFLFHFEVVMTHDPDIIFVTETWLSNDIPDNVFLCRHNYDILRCDRVNGVGGGVAILSKKSLGVIRRSWDNFGAEGFWVEMRLSKKMIFGIFYNPSVSDADSMEAIIKSVEQVVSNNPDRPIVVCGDFNLPGINWANLSSIATHNQDTYMNRFLACGLTQKVCFPTYPRSQNVLDLVFDNINSIVTDVYPAQDLSFSDHIPVIFYLDMVSTKSITHTKLDYRKMPKNEMRLFLELQNWQLVIGDPTSTDVEEMFQNFKNFYRQFCSFFVPQKTNLTRKPKYPKYIRKLKQKLVNKQRKFNRSPNNQNKSDLETARREYYDALQKHVSGQEMAILRSRDQNVFYSFVKSRLGSDHVSVNIISEETSEPFTDDSDCATYINEYFQSVFINDYANYPVGLRKIDVDTGLQEDDFIITRRLVVDAIRQMRSRSSPGPDGILPFVLKSFALHFSIPLVSGVARKKFRGGGRIIV